MLRRRNLDAAAAIQNCRKILMFLLCKYVYTPACETVTTGGLEIIRFAQPTAAALVCGIISHKKMLEYV